MNDLKLVPTTPVFLEQTNLQPDYISENKVGETNPHYHIFTRKQILKATTQKYRSFLKEAGYADLDKCIKLEIGVDILRWDKKTRGLSKKLGLKYFSEELTGKNGEGVFLIDQTDGRRLVEGLGYQLLTTQLMYGLFLPTIKQDAERGVKLSEMTLDGMSKGHEWLEDRIINNKELKIKNKEIEVPFPRLIEDSSINYFNGNNLNEWGYPKELVGNEEYRYWNLHKNKTVGVFCNKEGINCGNKTINMGKTLGVRLARFILEK